MSETIPTPSREVLLARLAEAEAAMHTLMTGQKVSVVTYGAGDGSKSVTYTATNRTQLAAYIQQLKAQLGQRRRAIGIRF